jgi:hypothetical protein
MYVLGNSAASISQPDPMRVTGTRLASRVTVS